MISKFSKLVVLAAVAAFAFVGCARQASPVVPPAVAHVTPASPKPAKGYSVGPAVGWNLVEESEMEGDEPQRVAEYEYSLDELHLSAYVIQMRLTSAETLNFLETMKEEANHSEVAHVLGQRMVKHGDLDSYEVLAALKMEQGISLVLAVVITDADGHAFYVACGGDINGGEAILNACQPLIKSFHVVK